MSHFSIVRDASLELRASLFRSLTNVPDVDFGFTDINTDVILSPPDSTIPDNARLSVYLYQVEPDPHLRNQRPLSIGASGVARAPMALRQSYLLTPLLDAEDRNQLVLGRIIQSLHDEPFIARTDGEPIGDSRGGGSPELRMSVEPMSLEDLSRIWHALGSDYRLSLAYSMRVVMIDSAIPPQDGRRVLESHVAFGTRS